MINNSDLSNAINEKPATRALCSMDAQATSIGRWVRAQSKTHPGLSGIQSLVDAQDAFAARVRLARAAERTLDVQYYIWHRDTSGLLLLETLLDAAERGVLVRLLLDDNGTAGLDPELAALEAHPNIEVRLFNPFMTRSPKWWGYITEFSRANRRMHNKSFTADATATIVGGRNVGDEYFGATKGILFADLDVLAIGPVALSVSDDFAAYWSSSSAWPVSAILPPPEPAIEAQAIARIRAASSSTAAAEFLSALDRSPSIRKMLSGETALKWHATRMVSDDPAKGLKAVSGKALLTHQLRDVLCEPAKSLDLISPYFVPTAAGVEMFAALVRRGVRVRVLTNALEATDVVAVHAGYAKRRKALLQAGIGLFEMRRTSGPPAGKQGAGPFGSSGSSLHAKTFAVDGKRVFVGSFNFDPRSAHLNTELGFVIDSHEMACAITKAFDIGMAEVTYAVRIDSAGALYWVTQEHGVEKRKKKEPGVGIFKRAAVTFMSLLPIEWML